MAFHVPLTVTILVFLPVVLLLVNLDDEHFQSLFSLVASSAAQDPLQVILIHIAADPIQPDQHVFY